MNRLIVLLFAVGCAVPAVAKDVTVDTACTRSIQVDVGDTVFVGFYPSADVTKNDNARLPAANPWAVSATSVDGKPMTWYRFQAKKAGPVQLRLSAQVTVKVCDGRRCHLEQQPREIEVGILIADKPHVSPPKQDQQWK